MTFPLLVLSALLISAATIGGALATRRYALFGLLGSTLLLALHGRVFINYLADDAFIYFRYAQNWADGHGPVWNVGEDPVEGYTGILWLLPLTGASRMGLDVPETARYLGFALAVGCLAMLYPLNAALPGGRERPLAPVLAGLGLAATPPFATWAGAGMEVPLFILLVLVGMWLHLREQQGEQLLAWSGLVFALAIATRPEGAIFAAVTGLFKAASLVEPGLREQRRRRLAQLGIWAGSIAAIYGGYFLWRWSYYDYLLPNTFYAKMGTGEELYNRGIHYVAGTGNNFGLLLLVVGLLVYWAQARPVRQATYLVVLVAAWIVWVILSGGDSLAQLRFLVPVFPLLYLGSALAGLLVLDGFLAAGNPLARPAFALVFAVVLLAALFPALDRLLRVDRQTHTESVLIGRWMAEHLPPGTTIAVTRAGATPYYSGLPAIDMLGLNDAHIAHADVKLGPGFPGHEKFDVDYVLDRRPEVIFLGSGLIREAFWSAEQYVQGDFTFPDEEGIANSERTFELYQPVPINMTGDGRYLNLLVSRDATGVFEALGYEGPPPIASTPSSASSTPEPGG